MSQQPTVLEHTLAASATEENHIIAERRIKLAALRTMGNAYPNNFSPKQQAHALHTSYDNLTHDELSGANLTSCVAGRMRLKRIMGKASFATLQDSSGKIQIYISLENIGEAGYNDFKHFDIGDILGVEGALFKTKTDELTIAAKKIVLLSKSLRPLPEKFHGLTDQEACYRQRYLDLIMNQATQDTFLKRAKIIASIRNTMLNQHYLEVETPMMHPIVGGATAKPFITHHNALDMPLYLRIAPELYLKRLIIGGLDRVFEINRNFRNEGLSTRHNPEFTMLEFYASYATYQDMMLATEEIIRNAAQSTLGTLQISYQGQDVDLSKNFARLTIVQAILQYNQAYTEAQLLDAQYLKNVLHTLTGIMPNTDSLGILQLELFEATTEAQLWQPTFILDYPVECSPLARSSDTNSEIAERFELFVVGRELANGYSELNDPEIQAIRFKEQVTQKTTPEDEVMQYDADYIKALEYGMPPTGGCGIGIDRLVMLLTDAASIKDVILFPHLRKE